MSDTDNSHNPSAAGAPEESIPSQSFDAGSADKLSTENQKKPISSKVKGYCTNQQSFYKENESYLKYISEKKIPLSQRTKGLFFPELYIPSTTRGAVMSYINSMSGKKESDYDQKWLTAFTEATVRTPDDKIVENALYEKKEWDSSLHTDKRDLTQVSMKVIKPGELKGNAAVDAVMKKNNRATTTRMPLWHSGFWLYYKPLGGKELSDIMGLIADEKKLIGTKTYGKAFGYDTTYVDSVILDYFFENMVVSSSLSATGTGFNYRDYILLPDLHVIYGYMMAKSFPNGFLYERVCLAAQCGAVHSGLIDLDNIVRVDNSSFTEKQKEHMLCTANDSMSVEAILAYQSDFKWLQREVHANNVIYHIKIPNLSTHLRAGQVYMDELHEAFPESLNVQPNTRQNHMQIRMASSTCAQYAHYIEKITIQSEDNDEMQQSFITDKPSITQVLLALGSDTKEVKPFIDSMSKVISQSLVAMVALASYQCSSCGTWQNEHDSEGKPTLIPIDPLFTFFSLASMQQQSLLEIATDQD